MTAEEADDEEYLKIVAALNRLVVWIRAGGGHCNYNLTPNFLMSSPTTAKVSVTEEQK